MEGGGRSGSGERSGRGCRNINKNDYLKDVFDCLQDEMDMMDEDGWVGDRKWRSDWETWSAIGRQPRDNHKTRVRSG